MSKINYKFNILNEKTASRSMMSFLFSITMLVIFMTTSGFNTVEDKDTMDSNPTADACETPLLPALGYNAFVRYGVTLDGGDTEGPIALGGDLTMKGIITIAAQTAGTNFFNGDNQASSLVVNGKVFYNAGEGIHLNNGYVKVGDLSGSSVFDVDQNNASSNTRVTSGLYDAKPRVQVQRMQDQNSVNQGDLIDFESAFEVFEARSIAYSNTDANIEVSADNKISLIENEVNILNLTGVALENLPFLTFENRPNQNTPLIINVDAPGDFEWHVLNLAGIGDQEGSYIIWNFYNSSSITLKGGSTVTGSLFAPLSDVTKNSSGNINGQVIAATYYHIQGELHQHVFDSCTDTDTDSGEGEETCNLGVDAGDDVELCGGEEVTLTATATGDLDCVDCTGTFGVENTELCDGDQSYVMWLTDGNSPRWFANVDLEWTELTDGTATLIGTVIDNASTDITLEVNAVFSGRTEIAPSGSPKEHRCNDEDASGWIYYTNLEGTVTSTDGSWSLDLSRRGEAFQQGNGANQTATEQGVYGASGWFNTTDSKYSRGDFNFNIGACTSTTTTSELTYLWSTGETTESITVSPEEDTIYSVTVTACAGCTASDEVSVSVNSVIADAGEDQVICLGEEVILTSAEADSYLWSTGETTQSITVSPTEDIWYSVTVTIDGCTGTDIVDVFIRDAVVDAGEDQTICAVDDTGSTGSASFFKNVQQDVVLTASEADDYLWSTGETTQSIIVSPQETTTYEVIATIGRCTASDVVTVFVNQITADAGDDQSICVVDDSNDESEFFRRAEQGVVLTAAIADSYLWSTGETTQSITVSPEETTTYELTVTVGECAASDEVTVFVDQISVDAGEDQVICSEGGGGNDNNRSVASSKNAQFLDIVLTASLADSYLWSTGETTQSITVSPEVTTTYELTVTIGGCTASDEVTVFVGIDCNGGGNDFPTSIASLYPTIVKSSDNISLDLYTEKDQDNITVSFYGLSGKLRANTATMNISKGNNTVDINLGNISGSMPSGIYLVNISNNEGLIATEKIVVE